jgi:PPOX class probable FMN-dependent enzyme
MKSDTCCDMPLEFAETEAEIRALYGAVSDLASRKSLPRLDDHCRHFIARAPFLCIATSQAAGPADISPRGDAPGFVRVLSESTLFIADRLGNNRLDSVRNVLVNPHVGLIFLIPGVDETLRVNGRARVVVGGALLQESAVNGKVPKGGLLVEVEEAFLQCAKALKRSKLWSVDARIERSSFPTLGKILADQIGGLAVEDLECRIEQAYREKLY